MKEAHETSRYLILKKPFWCALYLFTTVCFLVGSEIVVAREVTTSATFLDGHWGFGAEHAISGDGSRVVFESTSDITGNNVDGNNELFLWDMNEGFKQLTNTTGLINIFWEVDIDQDGSTVAVCADADIANSGATEIEIYRWVEGAGWKRLTYPVGGFHYIFIGGMNISADGNRIMFTSRSDYAGQNPTNELQVFLWKTDFGWDTFTQITHGSPCGPSGGNFGADLSDSGKRILFNTRCQYGSWNPDLNGEVFIWDETTGVAPLTNGPESSWASGSMSSDGTVAAISSKTDLVNGGVWADPRLFLWEEGKGFKQLSEEAIERSRPAISGDGNRIVFTAANSQGTQGNPEGNPELFLWEKGFDIIALTDSEQPDTSFGNELPDLSDDGTRLSMVAWRQFDSPRDDRMGYFVIDIDYGGFPWALFPAIISGAKNK